MQNASSNYSFNPWMQNIPIQAKKPSYFNQDDEIRYTELVDSMTTPADTIRAIRPPVGNEPFPSRQGYEQHQYTIMDVLSIGSSTLMNDTPTRQDSGMQSSSSPNLGAW